MNAEGVMVGERADGYCSGFLDGAYAMLRQKGAICENKEDRDPVTAEFLISILNRYHADKSSETNLGSFVENAFARAFPCK